MSHYVYAPKDDPRHRERWREPYPDDELDGFRRLAADGGLEVGFALSPGLSIDTSSHTDREALWLKVAAVLDTGVRLVVLALDDLPNRPGLGREHGELAADLHARLDGRADLVLVPTEYVGARSTSYLRALDDVVPTDVPIAWTGTSVVNDEITVTEAEARAAALGGRAPLLWDNVPVNDAVMADRLFLGPLQGRDPGLGAVCEGYLANPMTQARASLLPLASIAAWLRGDDPRASWAQEAEARGWRVLAEACDSGVAQRLVDDLDMEGGGPGWADVAARLARWLEDAATVEAPGLEDEAGPWLAQTRAEAEVGLDALRLYAATKPGLRVGADGSGRAAAIDDDLVLLGVFSLMGRWPKVRRAPVSVLGPRCSFRPVLGARPDGAWAYRSASLQEDDNALDTLVRMALDEAASTTAADGPTVWADGVPVLLAEDGTFRVAPRTTVVARSGRGATGARGALEPPLADPRL